MKLGDIFGFMALCLFGIAWQTAAQNCQSTTLTFDDCESKNLKGKDYTGSVAKTKKGLTCQKWTSQSPHSHGYARLGDHNFCRNPDGGTHVWCYTTSSKRWDYCDVPICDKSVEIKKMNETYTACMENPECEGCTDTIKRLLPLLELVTACKPTDVSFSDCESNALKGKDYTGSVAKTKGGLTCQKWTSQSPHKHRFAKTGDHNYCRNPDGSPHLWCYTTSSSKRWDYCDVPICDKSVENMKKKTAYTTCINTPACDGCENIIKKSLPNLIRENIIKEGEIGVNDGSDYKKKGWHHTLTLLEGDDIITKRTKDEPVTINGTVNGYVGGKRWYGGSVMRYRPTGLYAAPGDMVTVTFPENLSGKIGVNIGHYEYKIWFPQMQKSVFKIGSPWGGLIVLWLTDKDAIKGEFTITVDNAIKAPTYILGETTNEEWNNEIKHYAPKWALMRVPGQANIYVQTLKIKDITDMEGSMIKIKKSMDIVEKMIDLPEGSQPGAEVILFYPAMGGGYHGGGICATGTTVCGDSLYPLKEGKTDTYYDDFFKTLGNNGLVGHELGHGYCYSDLPNMGNQWTAEYVASYQRWRMGNPDEHSLKKSWWMNSTNLDFYLLDKMVSFSLYSDGKPCGEATFANDKQLYEGAYNKCWKWLNWIPQRLHGWQVWEKVNALDAKSKTKYPKRGNMKDYLEGWMFRQDLNAHDRMVDLYCQATEHNMLPLFDWYNINEVSELSQTVRENCEKLPESNLLTEWLNVAKCVKQSMNGMKEMTECEDLPRFPPHEGICLLNGVCSKDEANGGTTQMKNRFDLKGTYKDYDLPAHSEETCLKRAKAFFEDCENEDSEIVTATWVTKDGNSKHREFPRQHEGNCYNDRSERLMPDYQGGTSTMTPEECNKKCRAKHYNHFGVQYSKECWCGNEGPHVSRKVDPNECDHMCTGDNTRRCGGSYRANIWKVCDGHHCLFEYFTSETCPEGHTAFGKHCYYPSFKDGKEAVGLKGWLDARNYCRELSKKYPLYKYDLVSLQNEDEYNFILKNEWSDIYKKWKAQFGIWIGLNDRDEEGKWSWSDGAPLEYANPRPTAHTPPWRRGEPSAYGDEDCVRTYGLEGLTDRDCNIKMNFICEGQKESGGN